MNCLAFPSQSQIEVGVDEAGRGPLAFDVVSAAVIMPSSYDEDDKHVLMIKDSKKLSPKKRDLLAEYIKSKAVAWGIGVASIQEINDLNILNATYLAMHRALDEVHTKVAFDHIHVDGDKFKPYFSKTIGTWIPHTAVVNGDESQLNIAAASILAKTTRDASIINLMKTHPDLDERYGFSKNKGYGTKTHMDALALYGPCQFHRMSFAPCRRF